MRKTFLPALLLLAACTMPPLETVPDLTFANVAPVSLNVARIEVRDGYVPPMRAPNVDHLFRQPPAAAARLLLGQALKADGVGKEMRVVIEDASVIDTKLPVTDGVLGTFSREPSDRYDAKVSLRFEVFDPAAPDIVTSHAEVIAKRSTTLLNNYSPADRDRAAFSLTENLMKDVEDGLRTVVRNTFGRT